MKEKNVKITLVVTCVVILLTVCVFSKYKHSAAMEKQKTKKAPKVIETVKKTKDNQETDSSEEHTTISYLVTKKTTNKQHNQTTNESNNQSESLKTEQKQPTKKYQSNETKGEINQTNTQPEKKPQPNPDENKPQPDQSPTEETSDAYEKALALVEKTEQSKLEIDYQAAKDAISEVTNDEQAQELLDRLNQIQLKKNYQQFLEVSKKMYEDANKLLAQYQSLNATEKKEWIPKPDNVNFRKKLYTTKYNNILPTYPNELLLKEHQHKTLRIQAYFDQPQSKNAKVIIYASSLDYGWLTYYLYQPEENTWYRGPGVHLTTGYKNVINQLNNNKQWKALDLSI